MSACKNKVPYHIGELVDRGLLEAHWVGFAVGEDFERNLGDEEIET